MAIQLMKFISQMLNVLEIKLIHLKNFQVPRNQQNGIISIKSGYAKIQYTFVHYYNLSRIYQEINDIKYFNLEKSIKILV